MKASEILLNEIKGTLNENDLVAFEASFKNLSELYESIEKQNSNSIDEFTVSSFVIFNDENIGYPQELYKGINRDDIKTYMVNLARDLKIIFCRILKNNPDKDFANIMSDAVKDSIKFFVGLMVIESGVAAFFVTLYVCSVIQFYLSKGIGIICD